ncbi:MAG TPA: RraA family protein [Novosphingobium sp.]|nr:RraA family protein [Novosphingobium sp.]
MNWDLREPPPPPPPELVARLAGLDTATLGHWRLWGLCDPAIGALAPGMKACGPAFTLALPGADGTALHHALGQVRPGDVLVIDRLGDGLHAAVGGLVAEAAVQRGVAAIVLDGPVADVAEILTCGLPVWARGRSQRTTRRLGLGGRLNGPVCCGGAVVMPGDLVLADADGVAIVPVEEAPGEVVRAATRAQREADIRAGLQAGRALPDLLPPAPLGMPGRAAR